MADPIRISIYFDVNNRVAIQQGAQDMDRLSQSIHRLSTQANGLPRALSAVNSHLRNLSTSLSARTGHSLNVLNNGFLAITNTLTRLSRIGFGTLIAGTAASAFGLRSLAREFIEINQKFADLEITTASAFGSNVIGRQLRRQLEKITVRSPVPLQDLAQTTRSLAFLPQLNNKVAQQTANNTLSDPNGFFMKYISTIEKLKVFRPDKTAQDATFAIREAVTGELRSLIRRYDFPPQLLSRASGKSLTQLRQDPLAMIDAIGKALEKVVTPEAIQKIALQPSAMFGNIKEQLKDIPLLKIGQNELYNSILRSLSRFFEDAVKFVSQELPKYVGTFTQSLFSIFDSLRIGMNNGIETFLASFKLDKLSLPEMSVFERITLGVGNVFTVLSQKLPTLIEHITKLGQVLIPFLYSLAEVIAKITGYISGAFIKHPAFVAAGLLFGASIARGFVSLLSSSLSGLFNNLFLRFEASSAAAPINAAFHNRPLLPGNMTPRQAALVAQNAQNYGLNTTTLASRGGVPTYPGSPIYRMPNGTSVSAMGSAAGQASHGLFPITGPGWLQRGVAGLAGNVQASRLQTQAAMFAERAQYGEGYAARLSGRVGARVTNLGANYGPLTLQNQAARVGGLVAGQAVLTGAALATSVATTLGVAAVVGVVTALAFKIADAYTQHQNEKVQKRLESMGLGKSAVEAQNTDVLNFISTAKAFQDAMKTERPGQSVADVYGAQNALFSAPIMKGVFDLSDIPGLKLAPDSGAASSGQAETLRQAILNDRAKNISKFEVISRQVPLDEAIKRTADLLSDRTELSKVILERDEKALKKLNLKSVDASKIKNLEAAEQAFDVIGKFFRQVNSSTEILIKMADKIDTVLPPEGMTSDDEVAWNKVLNFYKTFGRGEKSKGFITAFGEETFKTGVDSEESTVFAKLVGNINTLKETEQTNPFTEMVSQQLDAQNKVLDAYIQFNANAKTESGRITRVLEAVTQLNEFDPRTMGLAIVPEIEKVISDLEKSTNKDVIAKRGPMVERLNAFLSEMRNWQKSGGDKKDMPPFLKETLTHTRDTLNDLFAQSFKSSAESFALVMNDSFKSIMDAQTPEDLQNDVNDSIRALYAQFELIGKTYKGVLGDSLMVDEAALQTENIFRSLKTPGFDLLKYEQDEVVANYEKFIAGYTEVYETLFKKTAEEIQKDPTIESEGVNKGLKSMADSIAVAKRALSAYLQKYALNVSTSLDAINNAAAHALLYGDSDVGNSVRTRLSSLARQRGDEALARVIKGGLSEQAQSALIGSTQRQKLGLSAITQQQADVLSQVSGGTFGFNEALDQAHLRMAIFDNDVVTLVQHLSGPNGLKGALAVDRMNALSEATTASAKAWQDYINIRFNSPQAQAMNRLVSGPSPVNNKFDAANLKELTTMAKEWQGQFGGPTPNTDILSQRTQGMQAYSHQIASYNELIRVNAEIASEAQKDAWEAWAMTDDTMAEQYFAAARAANEAASSAANLKEEITGRDGIGESFKEGFGEITNMYKEMARNFTDIGKQMAEGFTSTFADAFTDFAMKTKSASEAIADFGKSMLQMAIHMMSQKAVQSLLGLTFSFLGAGAAPIGSAAVGAVKLSNGYTSPPITSPGFTYDLGGHAKGGIIPGAPSSRDNTLAYVASGEFVIPANVVSRYGVQHFNRYLKQAGIHHYASGGLVGGSVGMPGAMLMPVFSSNNSVGTINTPVTVNVNVASNGQVTSTSEQKEAVSKQGEVLGNVIRAAVDERVAHHFRQGGMFAKRTKA